MDDGSIFAANIAATGLFCFFGLSLGSFATALIYRIPRGIPWVYNAGSGNKACRSQCTSCGTRLGPLDLIPLFSWLFSGGKCRHCKAKISSFYPLTELACMVLAFVLFAVWGFKASAFPLYFAVAFLVAAVVIDWRDMIFPDSINLSLLILAGLYVIITWYETGYDIAVIMDSVTAAILLTAVFGAVSWILSKWKGRSALGLGDIKFLPSAGMFIGTQALPSFMFFSGAAGIVLALIYGRKTENGAFPFGPALIFSLYIHLFLTGLGFDYKW